MKPIIRVENLSKRYRIGRRELGRTLRETVSDMAAAPFRRLGSILPSSNGRFGNDDTIWALKDVSFEVMPGDVVGIIGRNGAGKSTLLKILSRITEPTSGGVDLHGRVGSLLEVGTGFHPELTGRENIYLNGALLGMRKSEIERKFDEIVAFAEIERFLDTPVKRYSSGMYVRLAFAVAAHLEPEILIVDEVLAVGDTAFQRKCLGKMEAVGHEGRTVLFVSHNLNAVNWLCTQGILLSDGRVITVGDEETVLSKYIELTSTLVSTELGARADRHGDGRIRFIDYFFEDWYGNKLTTLRAGQDVVIAASYVSDATKQLGDVSVAFAISDSLGNQFTDLANRVTGEVWHSIPRSGVMRCRISRLPLMPGIYSFGVFAQVKSIVADWIREAGTFEVEAGDYYRSGRVLDPGQGMLLIDHHWQVDAGMSDQNCGG